MPIPTYKTQQNIGKMSFPHQKVRQPLTFNPFGYRRELNCKINDNSAVLLAESLLQQFKCACEHTSNGNSDDLRPFKGNII